VTGPSLLQLADDLRHRRTTSADLIEACLAQIADAHGEGARTFLDVDAAGAREAATAMDALRRAGAEPSPFAGIPVSVKDLFDIRGQVTRAGSRALDGPPATCDATAVARWRRAGLVVIGRTNMTEFAFSGLGINPHYGTPANAWDRARRRIPGGSSSGAAVSLTDGMAHGALGTDTGGSCRIPAALCGLVGFKPTQSRVPRVGVVPLSTSLDAVGVLGRTVSCCAVLDALLADETLMVAPPPARPLRLATPRNYLFADVEPDVEKVFNRTTARLRDAGASVVDIELPELDELPEMNAGGGFAAAEAYAWHHDLIAERDADYDPRVLVRIRRGEAQSARDLLLLRERRHAMIQSVRRRLDGFDAFICPTVPLVAPPLDVFDDDAEYARINLLMLRNPTVVNILDGCAASVPIHGEDEAPVGLMVAGFAGEDAGVLRIAAWIEEQTCHS
jgi:aspartyl-tRNA(Asn)/glutamyl-tRNA(Gln) amidotransferase subunit A